MTERLEESGREKGYRVESMECKKVDRKTNGNGN